MVIALYVLGGLLGAAALVLAATPFLTYDPFGPIFNLIGRLLGKDKE
jgi:hypothetical protein